MKRVLMIFIVLAAVITLAAAPALAQQKKAEPAKQAEFKYTDPMGVVKIKKGDPVHIACWMVVAGPDASLGTDTKRGVEIAVEDIKGKVLGHPIKISTQDTGCNAEGGQAAATKLASDPRLWRPSAPTAPAKPGLACRFCGKPASSLCLLPTRPLPDRPQARTGIQRIPADLPQRQGAGSCGGRVRIQQAGPQEGGHHS